MFKKFVSVGQSLDIFVIYDLLISHSPPPQMRLQQEQKNMFWKKYPIIRKQNGL